MSQLNIFNQWIYPGIKIYRNHKWLRLFLFSKNSFGHNWSNWNLLELVLSWTFVHIIKSARLNIASFQYLYSTPIPQYFCHNKVIFLIFRMAWLFSRYNMKPIIIIIRVIVPINIIILLRTIELIFSTFNSDQFGVSIRVHLLALRLVQCHTIAI